jgi:tetratricopeptide (TPR) repeat protein
VSRSACFVALLLLLVPPGIAPAAEPSVPACAGECAHLSAEGLLRSGVNVQGCTVRLCQEDARLLYRQNRFEEALAALDHVREQLRASPAYAFDRGLVLYGLGRFEEAVEEFDRVVAAFPDSIRGGAQRAHALERLGRLDEAQRQFQAMLDKPGVESEIRELETRSYLLGNIGLLKLRRGKLAEGRADLEQALDADGRNQLAASLLYTALPALEAGTLEPDDLERLQRAFEHLALGERYEARRGLAHVIVKAPRFATAYLLLGEQFRVEGRYDRCEEVLERGQKHLPEHVEIRLQRLRCTLLAHGVESDTGRQAIADVERIRSENPDNLLAREILAAVDR